MLMVFNKLDVYRKAYYDDMLDAQTKLDLEAELKENMSTKFHCDNLFISAKTKENIDELRQVLTTMIKEQYVVRYPHQAKQW
jgi:GTPase